MLGAVALIAGIVVLIPLFVFGEPSPGGGLLLLLVGIALLVSVGSIYLARRERLRYEHRLAATAATAAAQQERLAMAERLHDLASHRLAAITLQASTATFIGDATAMASALANIERTSRDATGDMRQLLVALRTPGTEPAPEADLVGVIEQARAAGLTVTGDLDPKLSTAPEVGGLVALVVREALANCARHCGPTRVDVVLDGTEELVTVVVRDAGVAHGWRPNPGGGTGLATLRDRCERAGGNLTVDVQPSGTTLLASFPRRAPNV